MNLKTSLLLVALGSASALYGAPHVGLSLSIGVPAPIVVHQPPPRPIVERMTVSPGPGYVWVSGHHAWIRGSWVWVSGTWVLPPRPDAMWVEGRWDAGSQQWIEGHWEIRQPPPVVVQPPPPPMATEVIVGSAPPPPPQDVMVARPGRDFVWISGYWAWTGRGHRWVAGHWERPPRRHAVWVNPRWERRGRGYVFVQGYWR